jgi:group I intron endonuclease
MQQMYRIYKITNIVTGEAYIGLTTRSLEQRWKDHKSSSSNCRKLCEAIVKYGENNFLIEEIEICETLEVLGKREIYWIDYFNSIENGYNLRRGGTSGGKLSEETKIKMSIALRLRWESEKYRTKLSKSMKLAWQDLKRKNNISNKTKKRWKNKISREQTSSKISLSKMKLYSKPFKVYQAKVILRPAPGRIAIYEKGNLVGLWNNQITCANNLNIDYRGIGTALKGKLKIHKGYIFEYIIED